MTAITTTHLSRAQHDAMLGTPELRALFQHPHTWSLAGVTFYIRQPDRDRQQALI